MRLRLWPALLCLLLVLGLPWLMSAKGTEWQTYLSDTFTETTVFPTGQFGEAFYTVDGGEYIIDGREASQDSLSALTDNLYYYNVEAECSVSESTAGELAFTGIVFHYKTTLQKLRSYYVFYVYPDGYYGAKRVIGDEVTIVLPLARSTEINTQGTNTLAVDAQGTRFDLYVNGKYVNGFTDVRIDGGGFGFYVSKQTAGSFDNFKVRVEARDGGQEEPQMPESTTPGIGTARGRGRFSIPRDPNRPTYPWEVDKRGKDRGDEVDRSRDDEDSTSREGPVQEPDEEDERTVPVVPPDEQVVIPPRPKQRETKPKPPPELEPETAPEPEPQPEDVEEEPGDEGDSESYTPPAGDRSGSSDESDEQDTYVTPGGLGLDPAPSRVASSDEPDTAGRSDRYRGEGFDKTGEPRRAASSDEEPASEEEEESTPASTMIALDPPAKPTKLRDPARDESAKARDFQPDDHEDEDRQREADKALREAEDRAREEQEERDREAERERKRMEREAEEAGEEEQDSSAREEPELRASADDDDGTARRDSLLSSMRSREWGDEESSSTYVPPRRAAEPAEEREPDEAEDEPVAPAQSEVKPPAERELVPADDEPEPPKPKRNRTRDLNVDMSLDGSSPAQSTHEGTTSVQETGRRVQRFPTEEEVISSKPVQFEMEPAEPAADAPEEEAALIPMEFDESDDAPADSADTILLDPVDESARPATEGEKNWDEAERTPEDEPVRPADDEERSVADAGSERDPGIGELRLTPAEPSDEFAAPEREDKPASVPLKPPQVETPELGELPIVPSKSPPAGKTSKPAKGEPGFFHLTDDFSQPRWPVSDSGGSSYRYFGAAYEIDNLKSQTMAISFQEERLGDMQLTVGSDFLDGAAYVGYGLAARFSNGKQGINYYGLFVSQTGECLLLRVLNGEETVLVDWTASTAFKASQRNVLKLEVAEGAVRGYVNGKLAVQARDAALPPGGYALLAGPGVSVRFDDMDLTGTRE